eukprot:SAG11_NODE_1278_length_5317_cov_4.188386_5_plen_96_part_00
MKHLISLEVITSETFWSTGLTMAAFRPIPCKQYQMGYQLRWGVRGVGGHIIWRRLDKSQGRLSLTGRELSSEREHTESASATRSRRRHRAARGMD